MSLPNGKSHPVNFDALLMEMRGEGQMIVIGGHYNWPGRPTRSAIASARDISRLNIEFNSRIKPFIFLNDIGATIACGAGGVCSLKPQPQNGESEVPQVADWAASNLPQIEATLIGDTKKWQIEANALATFLTAFKGNGGKLDLLNDATFCRLLSPNTCYRQDEMAQWAEDLELFLYYTAKPSFKPLLLAAQTGCRLPDVIFERTMNNGASRMLHDIRKRRKSRNTRLQVDLDEKGVEHFRIQGRKDRPIELRREENGANGFQAANMCPALLAHLFFYACKKLAKNAIAPTEMSVFYMIPCYDRARLADGVEAFFEIFVAFEDWLPATKLTLAYGFYMDASQRTLLCDVTSKVVGECTKFQTIQVALRERATVPSLAPSGLTKLSYA